ncbi:hypothetical protein ACHAXT_009583 [Thalassiosira profunda]
MCTALVADGHISSAAIANAKGEFALALPPGYAARATVECTTTDPATGTMKVESRKEREFVGEEEVKGCDSRPSFRPGYFDHSTGKWHDQCSSFVSNTRTIDEGDTALSPDRCPLTSAQQTTGKDLWIHLVGDSVTRGIAIHGLTQAGVALQLRNVHHWHTGRSFPDTLLRGIPVGEDGKKVWISFQFDHLGDHLHGGASMDHPVARTWGEFLERRSTAAAQGGRNRLGSPTNTADDPDFANDRTPDVVYWSPGYHASKATAEQYGAGMETALNEWKGKMEEMGTRMPRMHIPLNMAPAYWMIPKRYANDRPYRTMLNEHRKNLAILDIAAKFDFVEGVLDFNSVELPFHGTPEGEATAHQDAVHLLPGHVVTRVTGDMVLDAICNTRLEEERAEVNDGEKKVWVGQVSLETS